MIKKFFLVFIIFFLICISFRIVQKQEVNTQNTIVFWTLQLNTFEEYFRNVLQEFEKQHPNTRIEWVDIPYSEGEKRVLATLLSKNVPDLINITADFARVLSQKNALELIPKEKTKELNTGVMNSLVNKDAYTSFPFYATSAITIYNKKLVNKAGLQQLPVTFDELNEVSESLKKTTGAYAQMPTLCENDTLLKILNKYGINTPKTFYSEKTESIYEKYRYLYRNNLIPKESLTQTHREALEKYGAEQIVFLQAGANFLNLIKENSPTVYKNTEVITQLTQPNAGYDLSLMTLAVPKKSKNKELAMEFAQFLLNEKNQLEFAKRSIILPVNNKTLNDLAFLNIVEDELQRKARRISAQQLSTPVVNMNIQRNKAEITTLVNMTTQSILLDDDSIEPLLKSTAEKWKTLIE